MAKAQAVERRECWRARVADFRASGQSGAAWCKTNQIKEHQLWYWSQKFSREDSPPKSSSNWMPVEIHQFVDPEKDTVHPLEIRIGQAIIEVRVGYDAGLLRDVVQTLATLC